MCVCVPKRNGRTPTILGVVCFPTICVNCIVQCTTFSDMSFTKREKCLLIECIRYAGGGGGGVTARVKTPPSFKFFAFCSLACQRGQSCKTVGEIGSSCYTSKLLQLRFLKN